MKKILIALGVVSVAVLFWFIIPEEGRIEEIDCGNSMQLIKKTSSFSGSKRTRYGLRKKGTDLLAPAHEMVESAVLKLRVFYGLNIKVHVFDTESGEKVLTGRVHGGCAEKIWFCLDDEQNHDSYLLMARYKTLASPVQIKMDTIAVFEIKDGRTMLIEAK